MLPLLQKHYTKLLDDWWSVFLLHHPILCIYGTTFSNIHFNVGLTIGGAVSAYSDQSGATMFYGLKIPFTSNALIDFYVQDLNNVQVLQKYAKSIIEAFKN